MVSHLRRTRVPGNPGRLYPVSRRRRTADRVGRAPHVAWRHRRRGAARSLAILAEAERLRPLGAARSRAAPHALFRASLPDPAVRYTVARRVAGVGSLGRPRFVAIADWNGAQIAREAKVAVPSAAALSRSGAVRGDESGGPA